MDFVVTVWGAIRILGGRADARGATETGAGVGGSTCAAALTFTTEGERIVLLKVLAEPSEGRWLDTQVGVDREVERVTEHNAFGSRLGGD